MQTNCIKCDCPLISDTSAIKGVCASCRKELEQSKPQLRLRIFAYHIDTITTMSAIESHTLAPIGNLRVKVEKSSDGWSYRIDGAQVGNVHGAIARFADIVNDYCQTNGFTTLHSDKD